MKNYQCPSILVTPRDSNNETFNVSAAPSLEMKLKGNTPNLAMEIKLSNLIKGNTWAT